MHKVHWLAWALLGFAALFVYIAAGTGDAFDMKIIEGKELVGSDPSMTIACFLVLAILCVIGALLVAVYMSEPFDGRQERLRMIGRRLLQGRN